MVVHRDNGDCGNGSRLPRSINATSCYIRLIRVVGSEVADIWAVLSVGSRPGWELCRCAPEVGKRKLSEFEPRKVSKLVGARQVLGVVGYGGTWAHRSDPTSFPKSTPDALKHVPATAKYLGITWLLTLSGCPLLGTFPRETDIEQVIYGITSSECFFCRKIFH